MRGTHSALLILGASSVPIFGGVETALAQQSGAQSTASAAIEEVVVVSARRREEAIQDVPLSIAAFDAQGLAMRGVTQLEDLDRAVPNATFRGGEIRPEDTATFHIRGVPGVSTYLDGIVLASGQNLLSRDMLEIQRVEVLRGPQGTLFGRLSTGGALQLITVPPGEEFGIRGGVTIGDYEQRDANVTVDIPLADGLQTKWTAGSRYREGHQKSVIDDFALGDLNDQLLRGDVLWQPPGADLSVRFNYMNTRFDRNGSAVAFVSTLPDNLQRLNLLGRAEVAGLNVDNDFLRVGGDHLGKWETWVSYGNTRMDEDTYTVDVTWDFADQASLRFLGGNIDQITDYFIDNDWTPYPLTDSWRHRKAEQDSQEIQLLFNGSRFSAVVGLYALGFDTLQSVAGTQETDYTPEQQAAILAVRPSTILNQRTRELNKSRLRTRAIYGEVDYDFSDRWQLTFGLRYNEDKTKDYQMLSTAGLPPPGERLYIASEDPNPFDGGYSGNPFRGEVLQVLPAKFSGTTARAAVRYRIDDNRMLYVGYAEGFGAGGINVEGPPLFPPDTIIPFDAETVDNYEVGLRSDWLGGRLRFNGTLFRMLWDGIHLPVPRINPITGEAERGSWTINAGKGRINGLEVEFSYRPTTLWRFHFNAGWLDTRYTDVGDTTSVTEGSDFHNAPEFSYDTGVRRDFVLDGGGSLSARIQYGWMDDQRLHQDDFRANVQEAFGLLSAGITYEPPTGNWSVALAGTNLTNEWYTTSGFNSGVLGTDTRALGRPRQVSLSLRLSLE